MRKYVLCFLFSLIGIALYGQKKKTLLPEQQHMQQLTEALQSEDVTAYQTLFPEPELLNRLTPVLHKLLRRSDLDTAEILAHGYAPALSRSAERRFQQILEDGRAMGLRWRTALFSRYELIKNPTTRDSLLERLAPNRYHGYLFLRDPYASETYCIRLHDLFYQEGKIYGGMMSRIFPTETIAGYERHLEAALDSEAKGLVYQPKILEPEEMDETDSLEETDTPKPRGVVSERRYYRGFFDDNTRIELYLRGYAGDCGQPTCRWVAAFHIGDEDDWIPMQVVQTDSTWTLTEMPDKAVMELTLTEEGRMSGAWQTGDDQTGYEAELSERDPSKKKLRETDNALDDAGL